MQIHYLLSCYYTIQSRVASVDSLCSARSQLFPDHETRNIRRYVSSSKGRNSTKKRKSSYPLLTLMKDVRQPKKLLMLKLSVRKDALALLMDAETIFNFNKEMCVSSRSKAQAIQL